jgi:coenzyme PQQ biosynthesis protein PqqD
MAVPSDTSHPRLAAGCRWGGSEEDRVILFPEGAIKLQGTGRQVLERCDGQRTFGEIITELQKQFGTQIQKRFAATSANFWSSCRRNESWTTRAI